MRLGILTERYYLDKLRRLLSWLKPRADIELRLLDDAVLDSRQPSMRCALLFVKGQSDRVLAAARMEASRGLRVVNPPDAIWRATNRHLHLLLCQQAGLRVAPFMLGAVERAPFDAFVVKNVFDQVHVRHRGILPICARAGARAPPLPTAAEAGGSATDGHHVAQAFVRSAHEYKAYVVGERVLCQRRSPMLDSLNRDKPREQVTPEPALVEAARAASRALGLELASVDFLRKDGHYHLIDVNPTPHFERVEGLEAWVGAYLLQAARGC